jgi:hypothetical protein
MVGAPARLAVGPDNSSAGWPACGVESLMMESSVLSSPRKSRVAAVNRQVVRQAGIMANCRVIVKIP